MKSATSCCYQYVLAHIARCDELGGWGLWNADSELVEFGWACERMHNAGNCGQSEVNGATWGTGLISKLFVKRVLGYWDVTICRGRGEGWEVGWPEGAVLCCCARGLFASVQLLPANARSTSDMRMSSEESFKVNLVDGWKALDRLLIQETVGRTCKYSKHTSKHGSLNRDLPLLRERKTFRNCVEDTAGTLFPMCTSLCHPTYVLCCSLWCTHVVLYGH